MAGAELSRRLAVAGVGIPLGVAVIYLGGWVLGFVLAAIAALGAHEYYALASKKDARPLASIGVPAAALLVLLCAFEPFYGGFAPVAWGVILAVFLFASASAVWRRGTEGAPLGSVATTIAGILYTGGALSFALLLRHLPETGTAVRTVEAWEGPLLLIFPLTVTWMGDTAAYFGGTRWGRRKLIPSVSPGKTVVGGVAGLVVSVATALVYVALVPGYFGYYGVTPLVAAGIGLLIGIAAQVGDLAESVLKREAGVKDSGTLLPGHGGALDRFDAIFFTVPLTYVLFVLTDAVL